jgi:Uri superfamily endonuclease
MKGVYILLINVTKNMQIRAGSLGRIRFDKGLYAYVGSAQNGLERRIGRHLSKKKGNFWHIDYLLGSRFAGVKEVLYRKSGRLEECRTAGSLAGTCTPVPGFGCSDCKCRSHLFRIRDAESPRDAGTTGAFKWGGWYKWNP